MNQGASAKPPGFLLKMRLVTPRGVPLARKRFRVEWGDKVYPLRGNEKWETDDHGALSVLLDEPRPLPPQGRLLMMDDDRVVWSIALQICEDPPPVALPEIDAGSLPATPADMTVREEVLEYYSALAKVESRVAVQLEEKILELRKAWEQMAAIGAVLPGMDWEQHTAGDIVAAWRALAAAFALIIRGYEAAWRLWNLAALPLNEPPTVKLLASDTEALLRALDRFAYLHGLAAPLPRPVTPEAVGATVAKIQETHDKRGRVDPKLPP
jgi:hypothetical protein